MNVTDYVDKINRKLLQKFDAYDITLVNQYDFQPNIIQCFSYDVYYKALPLFIKEFEINKVLEIGTCTGLSALLMAQVAERVTTCDITDECINDKRIIRDNAIDFVLLKRADDCLNMISPEYDMMFIDIDHTGKMERRIHERIKESGFKGFVFYDDITMNQGMFTFWSSITEDKSDTFWHRTGFGIVHYQ